MNLLALDLGTKCGWAAKNGTVASGTWKLSDSKTIHSTRVEGFDRKCDPRFNALCLKIEEAVEHYSINAVVFEDVLFSSTTLQTQLWATYRAAIWAVRRNHPFEIDCLNTSTLKKHATGHGAATKKMMSAHLLKKYPHEFVKNPSPTETCFLLRKIDGTEVDDNQVDARHLLDYFSSI